MRQDVYKRQVAQTVVSKPPGVPQHALKSIVAPEMYGHGIGSVSYTHLNRRNGGSFRIPGIHVYSGEDVAPEDLVPDDCSDHVLQRWYHSLVLDHEKSASDK